MTTSASDEVALVAERLAVVLGAGLPPARAIAHLTSGVGVSVAASMALHRLGRDVESGPADPAWRALEAAWMVADRVGAPLSASLQAIAEAARSLAASERDAAVALAGPRSTARLMMFLPAVGLLFAMALGVNPLAVLAGSPLGWPMAAAGIALLVIAHRWSRRMIAVATRVDTAAGVTLDLMAIAVSAGGARASAERIVAETWSGPMVDARDASALRGVLALSAEAGVPAAALLRSEAALLRRAASADVEQRVARLGSRLMLPLGCCVLPAFMILAVAPLVAAIISSTVAGLQ